jgi:hypothetical protein
LQKAGGNPSFKPVLEIRTKADFGRGLPLFPCNFQRGANMAQPSESQIAFVADIEAGVRALVAQEANVTKISQVAEAAGREPAELSQYVGRFAEQGHWHLVDRLAEAFLSVNLAPLSITRAMEIAPKKLKFLEGQNFDSGPSENLPMPSPVPTETIAPEPVNYVTAFEPPPKPEEMLADVIRMINYLPDPLARKKVAGMTANWFGVGG